MGYGIAANTEQQCPALVGTLVNTKARCWYKAHAVEVSDWAKTGSNTPSLEEVEAGGCIS